MKLRHYSLWALALAFTAVSCSDDLENSGKGNQPGESKQKAYVSVNIVRGTNGIPTKATSSSNGEGDQFLPEITNLQEDVINDINIYLFKKKDNDNAPTNDQWYLKALNCSDTEAANVQIDGHGYLKDLDERPGDSNEPNHGKATVTVTLNDPLDGNNSQDYYVLTVVNAGELGAINNLKALREKVSDKAWSEGYSNEVQPTGEGRRFVMSTHQMVGNLNKESIVSLSNKNTTDAEAAPVDVYVERLAARVDLKIAESLGKNERTDGTFAITRYLPVNLYKQNSYIFKQVTPTVSNWTKETGSFAAALVGNYDQTKHYGFKYLGDEEWIGTAGTGTYNYVIDPKTSEKASQKINNFDWSSMTQYYTHHFINGTTELDPTNTAWKDATNLPDYDAGDGFKPIFYTKENTMSVEEQRHGFSTGVIFESTFTPNTNFKVSKYNSNSGEIEVVALPEGNNTFLTATHGNNNQHLFADVKTIAAMAFTPNGTEISDSEYKAFMDGETWPTGTDLAKAKKLINTMSDSNPLEKAFKGYLKGIVDADDVTELTEDMKKELTFDEFCGSTSGQGLVKDDNTSMRNYIGNLYDKFGVSYYDGGKSYYKFWIRHDDNNDNNKMAVMEFVIVRNNVYQLNVTGVKDFGDPLPFTPGKDDPDTPDESDELKILVNIYVKDWVNRRNADIIL